MFVCPNCGVFQHDPIAVPQQVKFLEAVSITMIFALFAQIFSLTLTSA